MDFVNLLIGFISGILVSILTSIINNRLRIYTDKRTKTTEAEYRLYLKLNDLREWYFWLAANETNNAETGQEVFKQVFEIATDIAKELRKNEESAFTEDFLKILYDESYESYQKRLDDMNLLAEKISQKVIPKHYEILNKLNESNQLLVGKTGFKSKAPAAQRFLLRL